MPAETETPALPEICHGQLDADTLAALVRDYNQCCQLLAVLPKPLDREMTGHLPPISLEDGVAALQDGRLRGLQVRYLHRGDEWWDTLLRHSGGGVRIVRMKQP